MNKTTENTEHTEKIVDDKLTRKFIGCAIEVHRVLGPGLLESAYQQCLARELAINGIKFSIEKQIPVDYKGVHLDCGYRIDICIEDDEDINRKIILELKSVDKLESVNTAQILTYMKLSNISTLFKFIRFLKNFITVDT